MEKANLAATGTIFNIQKFSINDGPGIRTVVFFKGCPLACRWCSNPESQLPKPQVLWTKKNCASCQHCVHVCSQNAISFDCSRIHIDASRCKQCNTCITQCPNGALEMEGERKSVKEVIDVVLQDSVFYEESGGGMTLSGGEFLSQPDFAKQLLLAAKENGIHTACETTGFAAPAVFGELVPYIDYVLFDMKHWNGLRHKEGTGVTNELPLKNMSYAIRLGKPLLPRIPVIPHFNDSPEDARQFSETLKKVGATSCQLLPFHQFGENKYSLLTKDYAYANLPSLHKEDLESYVQVFQENGIHAFF